MWCIRVFAALAGVFFVYFSYFLFSGLMEGGSLAGLPSMLLLWALWLSLLVWLVWESTRNYRLDRRWTRSL